MITRAQMQRQLRNNGGIMTVKTIRQKYGLGDFVRKIIPKEIARIAEVAAPIAAVVAPQFALPAAIAGGLGRYQRTGDLGSSALYGGAVGLGGMASKKFGFGGPDSFLSRRGIGGGIGFKESARNVLLGRPAGGVMAGTGDVIPGTKGLFGAEGAFGITKALGKGTPGVFLGTTALALLGQKLVGPKKEDESEEEYLQRRKTAVSGYLRRYYSNLNPTASATDVEAFVQRNTVDYKAEGGRIGFDEGGISFEDYLKGRGKEERMKTKEKLFQDYQEFKKRQKVREQRTMVDKGGIMEVPVRTNSEGVKELDMRKTGGFVPIGVKEKADDVPAMLSKNEFVMTADAVRAAGGGSIEKGAQRMYDTMKRLESRVA
jgi:hypothetical protein